MTLGRQWPHCTRCTRLWVAIFKFQRRKPCPELPRQPAAELRVDPSSPEHGSLLMLLLGKLCFYEEFSGAFQDTLPH